MYLNEGSEQTITMIDSSEKLITLLDGSKWRVEDINDYKLSLWLSMNKVIVKKFGLGFEMTNTNRDDTLKVKQV